MIDITCAITAKNTRVFQFGNTRTVLLFETSKLQISESPRKYFVKILWNFSKRLPAHSKLTDLFNFQLCSRIQMFRFKLTKQFFYCTCSSDKLMTQDNHLRRYLRNFYCVGELIMKSHGIHRKDNYFLRLFSSTKDSVKSSQ